MFCYLTCDWNWMCFRRERVKIIPSVFDRSSSITLPTNPFLSLPFLSLPQVLTSGSINGSIEQRRIIDETSITLFVYSFNLHSNETIGVDRFKNLPINVITATNIPRLWNNAVRRVNLSFVPSSSDLSPNITALYKRYYIPFPLSFEIEMVLEIGAHNLDAQCHRRIIMARWINSFRAFKRFGGSTRRQRPTRHWKRGDVLD